MSVRIWRPILSEANKGKFQQDPYYGFAERRTVPIPPPGPPPVAAHCEIITKSAPISTTRILCDQIVSSSALIEKVDHQDKENSQACLLPQKRTIASVDDAPVPVTPILCSSATSSIPGTVVPNCRNSSTATKTRPTTILQFFKRK